MKWDCNYSVSDYCHLSSIQNDTDMGDSFSIVLWAGTVGIGMRESGETEEVTRTKEEAWADMILRKTEKENPMKLVNPPKIPTVETDGYNVAVVVIVSAILSLIGTMARFLL